MRAPAGVPFVLAALAAVAVAAPQEPSFRVSVDLVRLDVLVLDEGRAVPDLRAQDFEVLDNGAPQRVEAASLADAEIDVILALDTSGSVEGRLLQQLTGAAGALVDALDARDRVGLLTFSQTLALRAPLTGDRARVRTAIGGVRAGGSTSVIDALSAALSLAGAAPRPTLVLVFSDGQDTASWQTSSQLLDQARRSDAVVDGVVVGTTRRPLVTMPQVDSDGNAPEEVERVVEQVTAATGGRLIDGSRGEGLSSTFVEALRSFRQRYQLTYSPTTATSGWHAIEVRVPRRRGATVRAKPGYLR